MASSSTKSTKQQYEQASYWVSLLHDRNCTPQQQLVFQAWLSQSPQNQHAYQEVEALWQEMGGLEALAKPQLEAARLYLSNSSSKRRWQPAQSLAIAASILLLVIAVPFVRLILDNGIYHTAKGGRTHIQLSDGTRIDLNTDSEIKVAYTFFERKVRLERGEALFTVTHDADKPFEVAASNGFIRDIGTQFNVYKQADKVAVTVLEGEVSVSYQQAKTRQNLMAGMQLIYRQNGQNQLANNDGNIQDVAAWRDGQIIFKSQRLETVLEQLSRYHSVQLNVGNAKLAALKVSGSFPTENLDLALNTIAASLPVQFIHQGTSDMVLVAPSKRK
ncbi:MAG: FecR family protein [Methyloglobulus sp.]|nr:FecR family protein [Methyloglobulus sp.]